MTSSEWSCLISFAWVPLNCSQVLRSTSVDSERGRERKKITMKICLKRDSNPRRATSRQVNRRFRPLCLDDLMMICGLMSFRIVEYKLIKPKIRSCDNTCLMDYDYMCMTVRLNLHFLSQCRY